MKMRKIYLKDALRLLEDKGAHDLKVWKLSTGDILSYKGAVCVGGWSRGGTHRVKLPQSALIREFRDVTLFEVDGMEVYW